MSGRHLEFAHAKLTLSLKVLGRRNDGYHLLEAEMVSIDLCDDVVIEEGSGLTIRDAVLWSGSTVSLATRDDHGVPLDGTNLAARALKLTGKSASVHMTKRIPPGSGLGGGSSDAAAVLRWSGMTDPVRACVLGADVPFCILGGHAVARGIGEVLEPLPFENRTFLLLTPRIAVSTKSVYETFDSITSRTSTRATNDLERAALRVAPELAVYRDMLSRATNRVPVLAGSGSTYFVECELNDAREGANELTHLLGSADRAAAVTVARTIKPQEA